jgi:hypothetical protein
MVRVVNLNFQKCDVEVCRPGPFGNPYSHLLYATAGIHVRNRDEAVDRFAEYFYSEKGRPLRERTLAEISDNVTIGCHCAPKRCHADIIAGYLNWKRIPIQGIRGM